MRKDKNLYEVTFEKNNINLNLDLLEYWQRIIGISSVEYVKKKWPFVFTCLNNYLDKDSENLKYEKIKEYYWEHEIEVDKCIVENYKSKNLGCFFYDFLSLTFNILNDNNNLIYICKEVYLNYLDSIYSRLMLVTVRSLIFEMNLWNKSHSFDGTANEAYQNYCNRCLLDRNYRISFYNKYPAVFRGVLETIIFSIENFNTFIKRLLNDKNQIENVLCQENKFSKIVKLESNFSDLHCGGKSVFKIQLDNDYTIIYKPHSVKNEVVYQQITKKIGRKCGIRMYTYKCIEHANYGWTEYVDYVPCKNLAEVRRYYRRMGIHIFVCYLLNSSDIHAENLIVHGEYPVIVDMETIISPYENNKFIELEDKIDVMIHQSVLHSGLLPFYIWSQENESGVDVSALNRSLGQVLPIKVPAIDNAFRIDMKIKYVKAISNIRNNLLFLDGELMAPYEFRELIIEMFREAYLVFLKNTNDILKIFKRLSSTKIRVVMQNTQQYSMMLSSSFHPELTKNVIDRQIFLYGLYDMKKKCNEDVLESEVKDLLQGDIPYFYCNMNSLDIYDSRNDKIEGFFQHSIMEQIIKHIQFLNRKDIERQCIFIRISLSMTKYSELKHKLNVSAVYKSEVGFKKEKVITLAKKYGDFLINSAIYNNDKTDVNWIGIKVQDNDRSDWHLAPLNRYFYDGKAGIAFYFHVLKKEGMKEFNHICDILDESYFRYTNQMLADCKQEKVCIGAYYGEASILYLYELCYHLYKDDKYLFYCEKQVEVLEKYFKKDNKYDLIFGNAGAILTIINLYDLTNKSKYLSLAKEMGNYLLKKSSYLDKGIGWKSDISPNYLAGLSHGNSGFSLAFAYLYSRTKEKQYIEIIKDILEYENSLYNPVTNNWKDLRRGDFDNNIDSMAWCHGASGILMSRLKLLELMKGTVLESLILNDVIRAAQKVMKLQILQGNCLCHGNFGTISILRHYGEKMGCYEAIELSKFMLNYIMKSNEDDFIKDCERYNPGIMIGATGIYYAMLKQEISLLPEILLLEI